MGLNVLCLTSQCKGAMGELFAEGFRLLVLFKATRRLAVVTRPHFQTRGRCSGHGGCLFDVAVLLPCVLKNQVNIAHPFSNRAEGLATFLLETTTASNDEWLLSKALVPVGERDVQGGIGALAILLIVAYQSPHLLLDVIWELQGNQVLSNCVSNHIFFSENHELEARVKTNNPASRAAACSKYCTNSQAKPVRPSHKARTIALRVANTCPSSSRGSGKRVACSALCPHSHNRQSQFQLQTAAASVPQ